MPHTVILISGKPTQEIKLLLRNRYLHSVQSSRIEHSDYLTNEQPIV